MGQIADDDPHRRRVLLQTRRGVDGVADDEALAGAGDDVETHERGTRVDADPHLHTALRGRDDREPVYQAQARPHRAFGVVLMQPGHTEHADHCVPDVLLDDAAIRLDGASSEREVLAQKTVDVLGVEPFGEAREADQVGEQHGDDASFGGGRGPRARRSRTTGRIASRRGTRSHRPDR